MWTNYLPKQLGDHANYLPKHFWDHANYLPKQLGDHANYLPKHFWDHANYLPKQFGYHANSECVICGADRNTAEFISNKQIPTLTHIQTLNYT